MSYRAGEQLGKGTQDKSSGAGELDYLQASSILFFILKCISMCVVGMGTFISIVHT